MFHQGAEYVRASLPHNPALPQWDTIDDRNRTGFTSYANITDHDDGTYTVWVYVVKRIRSQPEYTLEVSIKKDLVPTGPWVIYTNQGQTSAIESFALYEKSVAPVGTFSTDGLTVAVAGEAAIFSIQVLSRSPCLRPGLSICTRSCHSCS